MPLIVMRVVAEQIALVGGGFDGFIYKKKYFDYPSVFFHFNPYTDSAESGPAAIGIGKPQSNDPDLQHYVRGQEIDIIKPNGDVIRRIYYNYTPRC